LVTTNFKFEINEFCLGFFKTDGAFLMRLGILADRLQRFRSKMARKALTLLSAVYKVSVSAKWLAGIISTSAL
jgi:hypothetical protein